MTVFLQKVWVSYYAVASCSSVASPMSCERLSDDSAGIAKRNATTRSAVPVFAGGARLPGCFSAARSVGFQVLASSDPASAYY